MTLLNIGCGSQRPGDPWINIDCLRSFLKPGTPERTNLDRETNYIDLTLPAPIPLPGKFADAILCSHVVEHFDCMDAVKILADCHRLLKPEGKLVVSVPDADYFLTAYHRDRPENAIELFGEPINLTEANTFFDYGLFFRDHKQVLTEGALHCLLIRAGFWIGDIDLNASEAPAEIKAIMNRRKFSLEMVATKAPTTAPSATSGASAP